MFIPKYNVFVPDYDYDRVTDCDSCGEMALCADLGGTICEDCLIDSYAPEVEIPSEEEIAANLAKKVEEISQNLFKQGIEIPEHLIEV